MNRHHPYSGGGYQSPNAKRSPSGPGPDRSHRFNDRPARGGLARNGGGGSFSSYSNPGQGPYDQDPAPYNSYNQASPPATSQDPYYSNNTGYNNNPVPPQAGYNQPYQNNYQAGSGPNFEDPDGKRPRREKDDKVHDSIIEQRIQRERPCRTLFIRNIKYETNSEDVRHQFGLYGDIKTFFDLISTRGMVFVTYFDLRSAERAREKLQGSELSGRPIDVHYSLPRDDHSKGPNEKKPMQGTLQVTLRDSASKQPINEEDLRRKFQQFGDVKSIEPVDGRGDATYVEYFDVRACDEAFEHLRHQPFQDGILDIIFCWDPNESPGPAGRNQNNNRQGGNRPRQNNYNNNSGGGGGGGGGYNNNNNYNNHGNSNRRYQDDYDRRGDRDGGRDDFHSRDRPPLNRDRDINHNGYNDRYDNRGPPGGYGPPPPGPPSAYDNRGPPAPPPGIAPVLPYNASAPPYNASAPQDGSNRVEAAQQVQQLLQALKQPNGTRSPGPGAGPAMAAMPPSNGYYPPPPGGMQQPPYGVRPPQPPAGNYGPGPGGPPAPQAAFGNLPPNLLALLQHTAQAAQASQVPAAQPPVGQYNAPPAGMVQTPPPANINSPGYQQLMAFMANKPTAPH